MSDKYTTYQQHEPLRVPEGWNTQEKRFVNQLEEIIDDIYKRFGRLRLKDLEPTVREEIVETAEGVETLSTTVEQQGGQILLLAESKLDVDAPSVGVTNSAVTINPEGIDLSTAENGQITSRVGDEIELQIDKEGITGKKGVFDSIEAPNIVNAFDGGAVPWKGSIQATIDALPKYLKRDTYVNIPAGTYTENVTVNGFLGSMLRIQPNGSAKVTLLGQITFTNCNNISLYSSTLGNFEIYPPTSGYSYVVRADSTQIFHMYRINVSGLRNTTRTHYGVYIRGSFFDIEQCVIEYTSSRAIETTYGSMGFFYKCTGGGDGTANANTGYSIIASYGSHLFARDEIPYSNLGYTTVSGNIETANATPTAGGINYVAPTEYTQAFNISKHCTYLLAWSRTPDTQANQMTQGSYRGSGGNERFYASVMWFDTATSALANKTIISAQLTLRRSNGGYSNAVPVWLSSTTLTAANYNTTYEPPLTTPVNAGSLDKQTAATYDVTSLMSAIQAGGGIALYEPKNTLVTDTWSPAYTHFYGHGSDYEPVLTVKYR